MCSRLPNHSAFLFLILMLFLHALAFSPSPTRARPSPEIMEIHDELTTICTDLRRASSMAPAHFSEEQMALLRSAVGLAAVVEEADGGDDDADEDES